MKYETHELTQGSPEWLAHRDNCYNGSVLASALGTNPHKSRDQLIHEIVTGEKEEVTPEKQKIFDKGHIFEELARPLAEELLGEDLYPVVMSVAVDGLSRRLGSSLDGKVASDRVNWEHKTLNTALAAALEQGTIPEQYHGQMEQGMLINGAEKCLFSASRWNLAPGFEEEDGAIYGYITDDEGNPVRYVLLDIKHAWYASNPELRAKIVPTWQQLEQDIAAYQPVITESKPILIANPIDHLPALIIEVTGMVTHSNLAEFKEAANAVISSIKTELQTDQDFVDATAAVKYLKDVEDSAKRAKQNALDQTTSIADLFRTLDEVIEMSGKVRRALDKKITDEKDRRKTEIVMQAKTELADHAAALNKRIHGLLPAIACDFSAPIKGLKSLDSMKDKIAAALANAKIEANATADRIEANVALLTPEDGTNWRFLFPDLFSVCNKAPDDFAALLSSRIATHQAAEEKRLEAEREKIRKEEADKLAKAEYERQQAEKQEAAKQHDAEAAKPSIQAATPAPAPAPAPAPVLHAVAPISPKKDPSAFAAEIFDDMCTMTYAELEIMGHARDRVFALRSEQTAAA